MRIQKILFAALLALGTASVAHAQTSTETTRPTMALQHDYDDAYASDEREPASHDSYDKDDGDGFQQNDNRKVYHTHDWN